VKILKASMRIFGAATQFDTVKFEGKLWLVTGWQDRKAKQVFMPTRIIRFDHLPYQAVDRPDCAYDLGELIPKSVIDGETMQGFEIRNLPNIAIPYDLFELRHQT